MMRSHGWHDAPETVRTAIDDLLHDLRATVGPNLLGLYLHGSLAMGCFNPARSDLDLLVLTGDTMLAGAKRAVVALLLERSGDPYPIEISFLRRSDRYNPIKVWSEARMTGTGHMRHAIGSRVQSTRRGEQRAWTRPPYSARPTCALTRGGSARAPAASTARSSGASAARPATRPLSKRRGRPIIGCTRGRG